MRKIVRKVLLPLLFSFCFVFSGFLDISASAQVQFDNSVVSDVIYPFWKENVDLFLYDSSNSLIGQWSRDAVGDSTPIAFNINGPYNIKRFTLGNDSSYLYVNFFPEVYDYYLCMTVHTNSYNYTQPSNFSFFPSRVSLSSYAGSVYLEDLESFHRNGLYEMGFAFSGKIPDNIDSTVYNYITVESDTVSTFGGQWVNFSPVVIRLPKGTGELLNVNQLILDKLDELVSETNNVEQAVQQLQQAVEEQFSMSPEEDFGVDDVLTQHNEKMGVLSFGSDVMLQFLDMFQNTNPGTAKLTLPGFAITVQNVEYQVWQDQTFNFNQLETWFPSLINIIRLILPAFVWLMVLRYCIGVFERNFLSK